MKKYLIEDIIPFFMNVFFGKWKGERERKDHKDHNLKCWKDIIDPDHKKSVYIEDQAGILKKSVYTEDQTGILKKSVYTEDQTGILKKSVYTEDQTGILKKSFYIEDQNSILNSFLLGDCFGNINGCGAVAVYNCLVKAWELLKDKTGMAFPELPDIMEDFEKGGLIAGGRLGSSPGFIVNYLNKIGGGKFLTDLVNASEMLSPGSSAKTGGWLSPGSSTKIKGSSSPGSSAHNGYLSSSGSSPGLSGFAKTFACIILICNNYRCLKEGFHFFCVTKEEGDILRVHNYDRINKTFNSPEELLQAIKAAGGWPVRVIKLNLGENHVKGN